MNEKQKLPSIGIYVVRFPIWSETFIVTKFVGLIDEGFDIRIFSSTQSREWDRFNILKDRPDVRARIRVAPPFQGKTALLRGIPYLIAQAVRYPRDFLRFIAHCWRNRRTNVFGFWKAFYFRAHFIGQKLDILHVEFDVQAMPVVDLRDYLGCKLLLSSRGSFQKFSVLDQYPDAPSYLYRHVDGYHFISNFLRDNTFKLGLNPSTRWWLIEPAIDLSLFVPRPRPHENRADKPVRLLSVARLRWEKGYEFAIDAVAKVVAAGAAVEYIILGEGDYREAVQFAIDFYGLGDVVKLLGVVPREEVSRQLQEADILIHASLEEGFANAVIEAQASELPVVVSDAGGLKENVENDLTGFVVPRRDADAMAEKIIQLVRDPELRNKMGQAGRKRALERFDIHHQIKKFATLYRELAAGQG